MKKMSCALAVVLALLIAAPGAAQAQENGGSINVTWSKPFMNEDNYGKTNFLHSSFTFGYSRNMGTWMLNVQVPFVNADPDIPGVDGESALGNPRIGVWKEREGISYGAGIRLPLAPDDKPMALRAGSLADPIFGGTYARKGLVVDVMGMWMQPNEGGVTPIVAAGFEYVSLGDAPAGTDDNEMYIPFYAAVSKGMGEGNLMAGVAGNFWLTADDAPPGFDDPDSLLLMAALGYSFSMGAVSPEIWAGIPLSSDYGDLVDFFISIGFSFQIP